MCRTSSIMVNANKIFTIMNNSKTQKPVYKPNQFYHIYNHAANNELMFRDRDNYRFFMERWSRYLSPFVDVYAYCLMPDHFHFLIRVKNTLTAKVHKQVTGAFRKFFASYTLSFNRYWNRSGSLFASSYHRTHVDKIHYLSSLIKYIHEKPVEHKFVDDCRLWKYSSYRAILSDKKTKVKRDEVLKLYGGKEAYINLHCEQHNRSTISHLVPH